MRVVSALSHVQRSKWMPAVVSRVRTPPRGALKAFGPYAHHVVEPIHVLLPVRASGRMSYACAVDVVLAGDAGLFGAAPKWYGPVRCCAVRCSCRPA